MAEYVVSLVVKRLDELLVQEADILHGVKEQVVEVKINLELMQGFLKDAEERQDKDERVRDWVSEIREAAYNAIDVIETFVLKLASRKRGGILNAFKRYAGIINEVVELRKVGSEIEAIRTRIYNLRRTLQTYGIEDNIGEGLSSEHGMGRNLMQSHSHVVEEYTVGLDEDVKILVAQLVNEEKLCQVVSICGLAGLGKTTLAKRVYYHSDCRRHFDGFAWATISQQFLPRNVWEGILFNLIAPSELERENFRKLRDDELVMWLSKVQIEKKYLVILDDIWTLEAWACLSPAFPAVKAGGSKILLTTRNREVAQYADQNGFLYEPRPLTREEGWELLKKKAFPENDDRDYSINTKMEELGREMVGRCAGVPLAIVVLGGILATKNTLNEWRMVKENIISYSRRGKGHGQEYFRIGEVLASSYDELPYQLKPCFLHLGHFPEDFDIPTKKLFRMWIAEGIVSSMLLEGEETIEDVAECYLGELLDRGMVQVGVRGSTGRVKTCRLHDLMRDLCLLKANQENFLKIVHIRDANNPRVPFSTPSTIAKSSQVHRLAIYSSKSEEYYREFYWEPERTPYLRSLLFFSPSDYFTRIPEKINFNDLKLLKVLDLERCIVRKLHGAIGNLIHLRYLSLTCSFVTNFPSSIGNLRFLQTLILRSNEPIEISVPNMLWKMEQLRHLYLPICVKKNWGKLRLGNLSNLQTLRGFDARSWDVKELTKLTNLKKLGIVYMESSKVLEELMGSSSATLNHLCSIEMSVYSIVEQIALQILFSVCRHLYKLTLRGWIEKLPEYFEFPLTLTKLTLEVSELEEDPMPTLEKLPLLSILCLRSRAFIGKEMVCSSNGFPQLKSLILNNLPYLEEWCMGKEAMPCLCKLVIEDCSKLKMVPDGLRFITTLQELEIMRMPVAFINRFRVEIEGGGDDLYKVQQVPSIIFR